MSTRKVFTAFAAVALLAVSAIAADYTQSERYRGFQKLQAYIVGYLDLNDAQKVQTKEIFQASRQSALPILQELKKGNTALTAAVKAGAPDKELEKLAGQQGVLVGELAKVHVKSMSAFYALLTPAQKVRADELARELQAKKQHRRHGL